METTRKEADERFQVTPATTNRTSHRPGQDPHETSMRIDTLIMRWAENSWRRRWQAQKGNHQEATWKTPWSESTLNLYKGLKKHEASALMLLRTEIIGLNAWLASIGVPGISPDCSCGEHSQTVKHVLFYCPEHAELRPRMFIDARTANFSQLLTTPRGCHAAVRMLLATGRLQQFTTANLIEQEAPNRSTTIPLLT
ncbi:hypothetical protein K3495_g16314 [Podosphaera aphanis]|nr:hypothetical protein K3495_g16314 [Podosphaera aphanis]